MGTRSTITFHENKKPLVNIYQQYDGYVSGVGHALAEFLKNMKMVSGVGLNEKQGTHANGMGCLAAQFIAKEKTAKGVGRLYITNIWEYEFYHYDVTFEDNKFQIAIGKWKGTPEELLQITDDTEENYCFDED